MRAIVTGGSGFIGTNLVQHLLSGGALVRNFDIAPPRNTEHAAVWHNVDLLDRAALSLAVREFDPEIVFHLGARTDLGGRDSKDYPANVSGVGNLVDALSQLVNLRLVVFASTMLVCRDGYQPASDLDYCPNTAYGESKVLGEKIVRERAGAAMPWLIVRPTSIWGPWFQTPYRDFFTAVQGGYFFAPSRMKVRRSYGFVLNNVFQLATLAQRGGGNLIHRTVYLADYEPIDLKEWAEMIRREIGKGAVREMPLWLFRLAAMAGDLLKLFGAQNPPMSTFRLNNLLTEMVYDVSALRAVCGPSPYSVQEGVRITCEWLRSVKDRG